MVGGGKRGRQNAGTASKLPPAANVLSVLWHMALVGMFVVNRLDYVSLRDGSWPSHRSLLGGANDPMSAELREEMEQLIGFARFITFDSQDTAALYLERNTQE